MVLFVYTPARAGRPAERAAARGGPAVAGGRYPQRDASPRRFALIGAGFGEWQRIGSWMYYVLVAVAIAAVGFLAQFWTETQGEASIVNNYAVTAFLLTGFVAGFVYWLFAGRSAARAPSAAGDHPAGRACGVAQWAVGANRPRESSSVAAAARPEAGAQFFH